MLNKTLRQWSARLISLVLVVTVTAFFNVQSVQLTADINFGGCMAPANGDICPDWNAG